MKNSHFQFLENLVKEIDIPKLNPSSSPNIPNERKMDPASAFIEG